MQLEKKTYEDMYPCHMSLLDNLKDLNHLIRKNVVLQRTRCCTEPKLIKKHPTSTKMLTTIAPVRGFSQCPIVRCLGRHGGSCSGAATKAVSSAKASGSKEVHFIQQTLYIYLVGMHMLVEKGKSDAYIGEEVAIGNGLLTCSCENGNGLGGGKLLSCGFFFLFFFFFFFVCYCCCCKELEVNVVDCCIKIGVGGPNGHKLLDKESLVVVDARWPIFAPNDVRFSHIFSVPSELPKIWPNQKFGRAM